MFQRLNPLLMLLALTLCGCAVTRVTTTETTAVEEALLSGAIEESIAQLEFDPQATNSFFIDSELYHEERAPFINNLLRRRLLQEGLHAADEAEEADLLIYPVVAYSAIDDSESLIGIPSIPIVIPGAGTLGTPELALWKTVTQLGRNRMMVYAKDRETGELEFASGMVGSQRFYKRWTILLFFGFRTTDLGKPF